MLRASVNGSSPAIDTVRSPPGSPPVPRRMACAPAAAGEPFGASASSVSAVSFGVSPLSVNRIGARSGAAIRTDPASAARQSSLSASATAATLLAAGAAREDDPCHRGGRGGRGRRADARRVLRRERRIPDGGRRDHRRGRVRDSARRGRARTAPPPPQPARPTAIAATASRAGCGRRVEEAIRRERIGGRAGNRRLAAKAARCGDRRRFGYPPRHVRRRSSVQLRTAYAESPEPGDRGTQKVGANCTVLRAKRRSFRASPSANPVGADRESEPLAPSHIHDRRHCRRRVLRDRAGLGVRRQAGQRSRARRLPGHRRRPGLRPAEPRRRRRPSPATPPSCCRPGSPPHRRTRPTPCSRRSGPPTRSSACPIATAAGTRASRTPPTTAPGPSRMRSAAQTCSPARSTRRRS